uniref:Major facilitator superfamily (MFS) profile domain-containing protein n=1 Tax=Setaria digitata TaxID=48799 RepID=A0A915PNB2_9BILA
MYKSLDANKLLNEFGTCGRYQMLSFILCQFTNFFYAVSIFIMIFVNRKPPHSACKPHDMAQIIMSNSVERCRIKDPNSRSEMKCIFNNSGIPTASNLTNQSESILVEYELLCASPFIQEAGFSIFSAGALFVVPIMSHVSDQYGRRRVFLVSMYLSVIFSLVIAFSPNYVVFVILRFLLGAVSDTYLTIGSILCCETVAGSFREWTSLFGVTSWLLGYFYVGVLELFIKDWRKLYFASAIPSLLTVIYFWFNNVEIDLNKCQSERNQKKLTEEFKERTVCDLFKYKRIIYFLFVNGYITMAMNFYYFAVSLDSVNLTENEFTGYVLSGLSEIPGSIIVIPLLHFFGRRSITSISFFLQATAALIKPFIRGIVWARISCNLFGRMINEVVFASHPLLANEMMPTTIRSISYSIINIPQSIGIMFSPLLKYTDLGDNRIPQFILAGLSFAAGALAITLPETKGKPMPEDLHQLDPGSFLRYFITRRDLTQQ